jgi:hypothetical protein
VTESFRVSDSPIQRDDNNEGPLESRATFPCGCFACLSGTGRIRMRAHLKLLRRQGRREEKITNKFGSVVKITSPSPSLLCSCRCRWRRFSRVRSKGLSDESSLSGPYSYEWISAGLVTRSPTRGVFSDSDSSFLWMGGCSNRRSERSEGRGGVTRRPPSLLPSWSRATSSRTVTHRPLCLATVTIWREGGREGG